MPPEILSFLLQVPIVAAFVWFVIQQDKGSRQSIRDNHTEWRTWMTSLNEGWQTAISENNKIFIAAINHNNQVYISEVGTLNQTLINMTHQVNRLTTIALLNSAVIQNQTKEAEELKAQLTQSLKENQNGN